MCAVLHLQVELSQDDLKMLLRILMENLGEAGSLRPPVPRQEAGVQLRAAGDPSTGQNQIHVETSRVKLLQLLIVTALRSVSVCCVFDSFCCS